MNSEYNFNKEKEISEIMANALALKNRESFDEALNEYNKVLKYCNTTTDLLTAASAMIGKGHMFRYQSKFEEAESNYRKALSIRSSILGDNHNETLNVFESLALLYKAQNKYDLSKEIFCDVLQKRALTDPFRSSTLNNYSYLLMSLPEPDYKMAETLSREAYNLKINEKGLDHIDTAYVAYTLGEILVKSSKYKEALKYHNEAYNLKCKILGDDHSSTLSSKKSLTDLISIISEK
jgi:tetratricopeptide (TPR) repeat protein